MQLLRWVSATEELVIVPEAEVLEIRASMDRLAGSVDAYSCRWKMPFDQPRPTTSDMFSIAIDGQSAGVYSPADISIGDDGWIVTGNCPLLWVTERGFPTGNSMKMALMCLMGIPTGQMRGIRRRYDGSLTTTVGDPVGGKVGPPPPVVFDSSQDDLSLDDETLDGWQRGLRELAASSSGWVYIDSHGMVRWIRDLFARRDSTPAVPSLLMKHLERGRMALHYGQAVGDTDMAVNAGQADRNEYLEFRVPGVITEVNIEKGGQWLATSSLGGLLSISVTKAADDERDKEWRVSCIFVRDDCRHGPIFLAAKRPRQ